MILGLATGPKNLLRPLEPSRMAANTHAPQQGDIELRVDPAVKVAARGRDAPLPLEDSEMVRTYSESPSCFRDVYDAVHLRTAYL
jgi:hypothetical protein